MTLQQLLKATNDIVTNDDPKRVRVMPNVRNPLYHCYWKLDDYAVEELSGYGLVLVKRQAQATIN